MLKNSQKKMLPELTGNILHIFKQKTNYFEVLIHLFIHFYTPLSNSKLAGGKSAYTKIQPQLIKC